MYAKGEKMDTTQTSTNEIQNDVSQNAPNTETQNLQASENVENVEQKSDAEVSKESPKSEWEARFDKLSKREFALTQREKSFKETRQKLKDYEDLQGLISTDPIAALDKLGLPWENLIEAQLNNWEKSKKDPTQITLEKTQKEIEAIRNELKQKEKQELESKQQQTKTQVENSLIEAFSEGKEQYKFLSKLPEDQLRNELFEAAVETHRQTGKIPTSAEVCELLESVYHDQFSRFADLYKSPEPSTENDESDIKIPGLNTLNSTTTQQTPNKNATNSLTLEERKLRAIQALGIQ